jgi:guanine nucleotide-binding protein alpha-1 subunit
MSGARVPKYEHYRDRLQPLVELEHRLTKLLSSPDEDEATHLATSWQPQPPMMMSSAGKPQPTITIPATPKSQSSPVTPVTGVSKGKKEITVHTTTNWKKAFALGSKSKSPKSAHSGEIEGWWEDPDDPVHALNGCSGTMIELWRDDAVRQKLAEKRLRLEESSGL